MKTETLLYHFDDVSIDCHNFRIHKGDQVKTLTPRAFDLLVYLIEHRNRVVEKQELFEQIWKEAFVTDNALTRMIKDIRRAIGDDADAPRYIETVPKRGYRFIAVTREAEEASPVIRKAEAQSIEEVFPQSALESQASAETTVPPAKVERAKAVFGLSRLKLFVVASVFIGSILIVFIVVAFFALTYWKATKTETSTTQTTGVVRTTQITTWPGLDIFPTLSPDGNSIAYSSDHNGSFEIYVKQLTPGAREIQLTSDGEQNFQPAWSPDGKRIAYYAKNRGGIWVMPASGGTAKQLTESGSDPSWSPDGSSVAFQSYPLVDLAATSVGVLPPSTLWMVSSQGGEPMPITQVGNPPGGHGEPSWSPDGKRIIFIASNAGSGELWSISSAGTELKQVARRRDSVYDPIYSPDGEHIYYGGVSEPGNFVLYKLRVSPANGEAIGEPIEVANMGLARIKNLSFSADGKRLVYSAPTMTGSISAVPISPGASEAAGAPAPLIQDTSYRKSLPRFSPDGRKIAYVERRGGVRPDVWVMDADGKNSLQLTTDPDNDWTPSWLPDSERIAFQSDRQEKSTIWTVSIKSGREKLLVDPLQDMGWPTLSPDGRQVAFNSTKSGTINIWTVAVEGGQPAQLTFDNEMMGWPCWSPDGKFLAFQMRRGDDTQVMVMPGSGGQPIQLTSERGQSWPHSWSPDGDKIAFAGFRNGYWNIWWVSRSTKKQRQVTNYTKLNAYVRYPTWSPLGNQIVYEYAETTGNIWLMELK